VQDRSLRLMSAWPIVFVVLLGFAAALAAFSYGVNHGEVWYWSGALLGLLLLLIILFGFCVNGPNTARVTQLFGTYVGTLQDVGFFWGNPFYSMTKVSLRVRTFETGLNTMEEVKDPTTGKVLTPASQTRSPSKVNDRDGTPIEIAAVIVWKVTIPAEAVFNVECYESFIHIQSEAALRNLASRYKYDAREGEDFSLRGHIDEVANQLKQEVQDRVKLAGIEIVDARISYLAYAQEIAAAMLQRQQAGAIIAARQLIVEGAVGMVEHALDELSKKGVVDFDADRKAVMVSNLMVVLCGHTAPQPILNTGTLHN
jgi:regulator of protease activity HflC (stomatin/prohibitin superfamily)